MLIKIAIKIGINAFAVYIASVILDGVNLGIEGTFSLQDIGILALVGFALWLGNEIIKPLIKVLTFPLILVTFGLFNIIINILILWGVDIFLTQLEIVGFIPLIITTLIVSVINSLMFFI